MFGFGKKKEVKKVQKKQQPAINSSGDEMTSNQVLQAINKMQKELDRLKLAVTGGVVASSYDDSDKIVEAAMNEVQQRAGAVQSSDTEKVVEGVFDGQGMVGSDSQQYDVPANYASKSKLVEGDILKLTINNMGSFVYKQIKPIERLRKVGVLEQDSQSLQFFAVADDKKWRLLTASVTYFKGEAGDEVVFLVPAEAGSKWAAVENIVKE